MQVSAGMGFVAYMNPGVGTLLLQMLMIGVAGTFVFMRSFWQRIRDFFKGGKS